MSNPFLPKPAPLPSSGSRPIKPLGGANEPDYKNVPLNRPEPLPEEPKLIDALIDDMTAEARREGDERDKNPLFRPMR